MMDVNCVGDRREKRSVLWYTEPGGWRGRRGGGLGLTFPSFVVMILVCIFLVCVGKQKDLLQYPNHPRFRLMKN